jgi:pilus assembly protein CpaF
MRGESLEEIAQRYKGRLLKEANLDQLTRLPRPQLRQTLESLVSTMMNEDRLILTQAERQQVVTWIIDESAGFGPLEPLLQDPSVTEIMVVRPNEVYIEREGRIERSPVRFRDQQHVRHVVERIIAPLGRHLDEASPMVDARLPDGSRVNAIAPPLCLNGVAVTIRRFAARPLSLDDLVERQALTPAMARFLRGAIRAKLNLLIAGGTGSGKTTLLSAVAQAINPGERIVLIEDLSEIKLDREHVLSLEGRPASSEGKGEVTIRHLLRNALRMRPDRIIVGEVRGDEAMDMLQAMNTGHEGSLTTIHANSPADAFARLEAMVILSGVRLPIEILRHHLVSAINLVVQTHRYEDGTRRIAAISEVEGAGPDGMRLRPLFSFERSGVAPDGTVLGQFVQHPGRPLCLDRLYRFGQKEAFSE